MTDTIRVEAGTSVVGAHWLVTESDRGHREERVRVPLRVLADHLDNSDNSAEGEDCALGDILREPLPSTRAAVGDPDKGGGLAQDSALHNPTLEGDTPQRDSAGCDNTHLPYSNPLCAFDQVRHSHPSEAAAEAEAYGAYREQHQTSCSFYHCHYEASDLVDDQTRMSWS